MKKDSQTYQYYFLSTLSFFLHFFGIFGMRILTIVAGILIGIRLEKYIGKLGISVSWILSLLLFGFVILVLERLLYPYLEKLDDQIKANKKYPYTEKYGVNYPKPTPKDFELTQDEFKEYNSRFQFENIKIISTYGLWFGVLAYVCLGKVNIKFGLILLIASGLIGLLLNYLFNRWNKKISKEHRLYEKINKYQVALDIYYKISKENSTL